MTSSMGSQSLAQRFVLLSLVVLPATPLQIAYRGLHTTESGSPWYRALRYLEGVLPTDIRNRLWPFLGNTWAVNVGARGRRRSLPTCYAR